MKRQRNSVVVRKNPVAPKNLGGRPVLYSAELAKAILEQVAEGITVRELCRRDDMPGRQTIRHWCEEYPGFKEGLAKARDHCVHEVFPDEIIEISDDARNDWIERRAANGEVFIAPDREQVTRSALRIGTRKWLMAKFAPEKFGDKIHVEGSGTTVNILNQAIKQLDDPNITQTEAARIYARMISDNSEEEPK